MKKRLHVYYSGTVQGVGFRFTTERIAVSLGLQGWVKNLFNGKVEIICEGEEPDLVLFLGKARNGPMKRYITGADVDWQEATGEFKDFTVRF